MQVPYFIPYYLNESMKAVGVTHETFSDACCGRVDNPEDVFKRVPLNDLVDYVVFNDVVMRNNMKLSYDQKVSASFAFNVEHSELANYVEARFNIENPTIRETAAVRLINDMSSNKRDLPVIENGEEKFFTLFDMTHNGKTLHVIVQQGFTDFIKFNDQKFLEELYEEMVDFAFSRLPDTAVFNSIMFKKFIAFKKPF